MTENYTFAWKRNNSHLAINSNSLSLATSGNAIVSITSAGASITGTTTVSSLIGTGNRPMVATSTGTLAVEDANTFRSTIDAAQTSHTHNQISQYNASPHSSAVPSSFAPTAGLSFHTVYNTGYPSPYGNILNIRGTGGNQIFTEWSGGDAGPGGLWFRNKRDNYNGWSPWQQVIDTVTHAQLS